MPNKSIQVTKLIVERPTLQINVLRIVEDWVIHLTFKDASRATEE